MANEWISTKHAMPDTGYLCWIIWSGQVQHVAYRRVGRGFACCDGYVWECSYDLGVDDMSDNEVTHWMPLPEPPRNGESL